MEENNIATMVVNASLKVHKALGPGLFEQAYEACLYHELCKLDLFIERQKQLPLLYDGVLIDTAYKIDLIVESKVIIELKACKSLEDIHFAQILTYLKLTKCKLGLLINFNTPLLKNGIRRIANGL